MTSVEVGLMVDDITAEVVTILRAAEGKHSPEAIAQAAGEAIGIWMMAVVIKGTSADKLGEAFNAALISGSNSLAHRLQETFIANAGGRN